MAAALVPASSLTGESVRYEIPKAIGYWLPWLCVPGAAGVVAALWRWQSPPAARFAAVAAVLAIALLPLGAAIPNTQQASHPVADTLAYDLRTAESGYWIGYPDSRLLLDAPERQFVDRILALESSGDFGAHDRLLNVAASLQAWKSIPIGVFTGALETLVAADFTPTIFTTGNRLFAMPSLGTELKAGFAWVVLEPAGLTPSVRSDDRRGGLSIGLRELRGRAVPARLSRARRRVRPKSRQGAAGSQPANHRSPKPLRNPTPVFPDETSTRTASLQPGIGGQPRSWRSPMRTNPSRLEASPEV